MTKTKSRNEPPVAAGGTRQRVRGLYALTPDTSNTGELQRRVGEALAGGARWFSIGTRARMRMLRREQADMLVALCRERGVPLIVNDDVELARDCRRRWCAFGSRRHGCERGARGARSRTR